ncbi:MAG TPA: hypothetical protein VLJ62_31535, partial [Burkholderiaceae bacterium]|nr:hypothetical protein [Burkholderiaceae bacterium]
MSANIGTDAVQAPAALATATGGLFVLSTPQPADGATLRRFMSLARATHRDASAALARWLDEHVGPRA